MNKTSRIYKGSVIYSVGISWYVASPYLTYEQRFNSLRAAKAWVSSLAR